MSDLRLAPEGAKISDHTRKARALRAAARQIESDYASQGHHDKAKLVRLGFEALDDRSLAKLHDLICTHSTRAEAAAALAAEQREKA
jgi:hypothetical protein